MQFSQDFIEKVRDANNIVEIIGQHTELKGSGHRMTGRCPFPDHSDKSPSFSVTEDQQYYYCFGCKKGGNVFTFLTTFNGMSFPESVEFLARRASIPLPEKDERAKRSGGLSGDQKDLYLKINKTAAVYYHHQLMAQTSDSPAQRYLVKRGLTPEIVEKFRLGLSLEAWQGLANFLESKGVPLKMAEALGLIRPKKGVTGTRADSYFDLFRERLMFPIFSTSNEVIGFGGRTLTDALPKYVNSSDSPVFNKSRVLYGIHETGKFIRAQDEAIVVEGYMDAISLYAAGIKNVVAILGTAFTPEHAKVLKRYTVNVKMLLDGDDAGIGGAERSLPVLLEAGLMPKGFVLPDKMDPDDFVKANGADALRKEIDRAPELFSLLLRKRWLVNYHGSPSEKVQIVGEAAHAVKNMPNQQLAELYFLELGRELDVDLPWIRRAISQAQAALQARTGKPITTPVATGSSGGSHTPRPFHGEAKPGDTLVPMSARGSESPQGTGAGEEEILTEAPLKRVILQGAPKDEAFVLSLLLSSESLMRDLLEAGPDDVLSMFSHDGVRELLSRAVARYREKPSSFAHLTAILASEVDLPGVLGVSTPLMSTEKPEGFEKKVMGDYMTAIRSRFLKGQLKAKAQSIREQPSTEKLEEFMTMQRDRLGPNREGT